MRTALLSVLALVAGTAVVTGAVVGATGADAGPATRSVSVHDAAVAAEPQLDVTGTLIPLDGETDAPDRYAVRTDDGQLLPVSLDLATPLERPARFTGSLALGSTLQRTLHRRGLHTASRQHVDAATASGRTALAAAETQPSALRVSSATITPSTATTATTPTAERLYAAVITNRGTIEESHATIDSDLAAIRSYWQTEGGSLVSSFTQPTATVYYNSTAAPDVTSGCGLANPTAVWNEAAQQFPGVDFGATGNHLMVLVADDCSGSAGAGIGMVGRSLASGGDTMVSLGDVAVSIGVHELGHNFSLQHANAQQCSSSSCSTIGYYDIYSIMGLAVSGGGWTPPALNTARRLQLGVADSAEAPTVTASGTVHLNPRGASSGTRGFVVSDPASGARYVVDYRSGTGRDATAFYGTGDSLTPFAYRPGVTVERVESDGSTTLMTSTSGSSVITSMIAGQSMTLGSLTLTVSAASPSTGADVLVTLPGSTPSAPSGTPTTSTPNPSTAPTSTPTPTAQRFTMTSAPGVVGTPQVGVTVYATAGRWSPRPDYVTYQWLAGGAAISGATGWSFTPSAAQLGRQLSVRVTVRRIGVRTASATSAATAAVAAGRFSAGRPAVRGVARVGRTLTAVPGRWSPTAAFAYQWYADGHAIAHATGSTLTLRPAVRGSRISVRVTAVRTGYRSAARTSAVTVRVR